MQRNRAVAPPALSSPHFTLSLKSASLLSGEINGEETRAEACLEHGTFKHNGYEL